MVCVEKEIRSADFVKDQTIKGLFMDKKAPLVSVVVPVYNVERFLDECVESVLKQTMQDFDIILVDDGSTDSSGKSCDELAEKDNRIKVIHRENGGLSAARNTGFSAATGTYVYYLDSDDWIKSDTLEKQRLPKKKRLTSYSLTRLCSLPIVSPIQMFIDMSEANSMKQNVGRIC